jgi:toxin ParE1/3/4
VAHKVVFSEGAWQDVDEIYDWIEERADAEAAFRYLTRIHDFCFTLRDFPNRGTPRDDLAPGVRTIAFEGRVVIAYTSGERGVRILRILSHGRDATRAFSL